VTRLPSALAMTTALPPSKMLNTEFVVPRSIPIIDDIFLSFIHIKTLSAHHADQTKNIFVPKLILASPAN
jgi:hypothetical protein